MQEPWDSLECVYLLYRVGQRLYYNPQTLMVLTPSLFHSERRELRQWRQGCGGEVGKISIGPADLKFCHETSGVPNPDSLRNEREEFRTKGAHVAPDHHHKTQHNPHNVTVLSAS